MSKTQKLDELNLVNFSKKTIASPTTTHYSVERRGIMGDSPKTTKLIDSIWNKQNDTVTFRFLTEATEKYGPDYRYKDVDPEQDFRFERNPSKTYEIYLEFFGISKLFQKQPLTKKSAPIKIGPTSPIKTTTPKVITPQKPVIQKPLVSAPEEEPSDTVEKAITPPDETPGETPEEEEEEKVIESILREADRNPYLDIIKNWLWMTDFAVWSNAPSFHWQGFNYNMSRLGAAINPTNIKPKVWNKTHGKALIDKHLFDLFIHIKFFINQMASSLYKKIKIEKSGVKESGMSISTGKNLSEIMRTHTDRGLVKEHIIIAFEGTNQNRVNIYLLTAQGYTQARSKKEDGTTVGVSSEDDLIFTLESSGYEKIINREEKEANKTRKRPNSLQAIKNEIKLYLGEAGKHDWEVIQPAINTISGGINRYFRNENLVGWAFIAIKPGIVGGIKIKAGQCIVIKKAKNQEAYSPMEYAIFQESESFVIDNCIQEATADVAQSVPITSKNDAWGSGFAFTVNGTPFSAFFTDTVSDGNYGGLLAHNLISTEGDPKADSFEYNVEFPEFGLNLRGANMIKGTKMIDIPWEKRKDIFDKLLILHKKGVSDLEFTYGDDDAGEKDDNPIGLTGKGFVDTVLATVKAGLLQYVKEHKDSYDILSFSGHSDSKSRAATYKRLTGAVLGEGQVDYKLVILVHNQGLHTTFHLLRTNIFNFLFGKFNESLKEAQKEEKTQLNDTLVMTYGTFTPPTKHHTHLLKTVIATAKKIGGSNVVFLQPDKQFSHDMISIRKKAQILMKAVPEVNICLDEDLADIYDAFVWAYNRNYHTIVVVTGSEKIGVIQEILQNNNKQYTTNGYFKFDKFHVVSYGGSDPDESPEVVTARNAVINKDLQSFIKAVQSPDIQDYNDLKVLYDLLSYELEDKMGV